MQKIYYSYEDFRGDTRKIIQEIESFDAEAIVGVARGGLTLSHTIAEGLNIRDVQTIRTELYDGDSKRQDISLFGLCSFKNIKRVLVVDDIADSGKTLEFIMKYLELNFPDIEFKTATLFYKKTSVYEPTIWIKEAKEWIEFFWEKDYEAKK